MCDARLADADLGGAAKHMQDIRMDGARFAGTFFMRTDLDAVSSVCPFTAVSFEVFLFGQVRSLSRCLRRRWL